MKITKGYLKQLIKEELSRIHEGDVIDASSRFRQAGERPAEEPVGSGDVRHLKYDDRREKNQRDAANSFFEQAGNEFGMTIRKVEKSQMSNDEATKHLYDFLLEKLKSGTGFYAPKYFDLPGGGTTNEERIDKQGKIFKDAAAKHTKNNVEYAFKYLRGLLNDPKLSSKLYGRVELDDKPKGYTRRKPSITDDM